MKGTITWVATFNGAKAKLYAWQRKARTLEPLDLGLADSEHRPEYADHLVTIYSSVGSARGAREPETDGERALEDDFVARVGATLAAHAENGAFDRLCIAASPRALGAFRRSAPADLTNKVWLEMPHDYVNTSPTEMIERLEAQERQ